MFDPISNFKTPAYLRTVPKHYISDLLDVTEHFENIPLYSSPVFSFLPFFPSLRVSLLHICILENIAAVLHIVELFVFGAGLLETFPDGCH